MRYLPALWLLISLGAAAAAEHDAEPPRKAEAAADTTAPRSRLSSPREMLELFLIDDSQIRQLRDGRPFHPDEHETLLKILYRLPHFGLERIDAWCAEEPPWPALAEDPDRYRLQFFHLRGRAIGLETAEPPAESAARFEFPRYQRIRMAVDGCASPVSVFTRNVPVAWQAMPVLDERAGACGLLLKTGESDGVGAELVFAAERIAWFPDREAPQAGIGPSHVLLGELGMDVGLFDGLRATNRKGLEPGDREAFYQLLDAVRRAPADDIFRQATGGFELRPMLTEPESQQGRLITVTGMARRAQKILVDDPAIQQRFGLDHYYQVDIFVPLGDEEVRLGAGGEDESPTFRHSYPVNVCVPSLPAGMPVGDEIREDVRIAGFYFKLWAYRTEFVSSFDREQRQIGPLLIAAQPQRIEPPASSALGQWIAAIVFLALLAALWIAIGWYRRGDRRFSERFLRRRGVVEGEAETRQSGESPG